MLSGHETIQSAITITMGAFPFMAWNTFLALVPLTLAYVLFSGDRKKIVVSSIVMTLALLPRLPSAVNGLWKVLESLSGLHLTVLIIVAAALLYWSFYSIHRPRVRLFAGLLVFYAFLPNAPYVLTDVIHLIETIREYSSEVLLTVVVIPIYAAFMLIGFTAYILALMELSGYMTRQGYSRFVLRVQILTHVLSAIGIYLGRFLRFNSWDVATSPETIIARSLDSLTSRDALILITASFVIIGGLYWAGSTIIAALHHHREHLRQQRMEEQTVLTPITE